MLRVPDPTFLDLTTLLSPRSVAVIGASDRGGNLGGDTVHRLVKFGFPGPIWPVNRSLEPVAGQKAYPSVTDLPAAPDVAIFSIPASGLHDAIAECIAKGCFAGVAYAGGLAESGQAEGIAEQERIAKLCRENGFMLCGPNCVGLINTSVPVTSTFATAIREMDSLRPGSISMVSQSGGIGTTALSLAETAGFGFRHMISGGNEAVVTFADYLYALALDEGTDVIIGYLEGVKDGPKFLKALEAAQQRGKPIVMIKAGRTSDTARAAKAHTGSLVGEDSVFEAIFQETGVIRADSVDEAVEVALLIAGDKKRRMPAGPNVGVVTFGGGNGVLGVDQCHLNGLKTPMLSAEAGVRLKPLLASVASAANPMDLTPTTAFRPESLALLPKALDVMAEEPGIDSMIFIVSGLGSKGDEITEVIHDFWKRSEKPVCVCWSAPPSGIIAKLAALGIYAFVDQARGIRSLALMASRAGAKPGVSVPNSDVRDIDWIALAGDLSHGGVVSEDRCHEILRAAGLPAAPGRLATSEAEAKAIAAEIGYPVVMKGITPAVTHRAAAGLLAVGPDGPDAVAAAWKKLSDRADAIKVTLDGILVQKMAKGGSELLVAAYRDPLFGVMVTVGAGGGLTELLKDVVNRRAPVSAETAADMIAALRLRPHAKDNDGLLPLEPAARFVADFSALAATAPFEKFVFEVNPIKWTRDAAVAVDGLLIVG